MNKYLIFRTDRIGDLLITCPLIATIKKHLTNSRITLITSVKNYEYAKSFGIFDKIDHWEMRGNHAVLLVGCGTENDTKYWILKNW